MTAVHEAGCPALLLTKSYTEALTLYTREAGIMRGGTAVSHIVFGFTRRASVYMPIIERDRRIGAKMHSLSILPTSSDRVFRNPKHAFKAAASHRSVPHGEDEVLTLHLIARGPHAALKMIHKTYEEIRNSFSNLLDSDEILTEVDDSLQTYDLAILYGLREDPMRPLLAEGYEAVAERMPELQLDVEI